MDGLAGYSRLRFWVAVTATATVVVLPVYLLRIRPFIDRINRRRKSERLDGLYIISEPENAEDVTFEIVAVHGLGADPEHTWTAAAVESSGSNKKDSRRVHLLKDFLKHDFPSARISAFAHNSNWLIDAPVTTAHQIGERLLDELVDYRLKYRHVPIIFIGHSFGGIIIKEALCKSGDAARDIVDSTSGIIFLGTPHQGSSVSTPAAILAWVTTVLGSESGLPISLTHHRTELADLDVNFVQCMREKERRTRKTEIIAFCEMRSTYFAGISVGRIVSQDSARGGHATKTVHIDTDHSGLNKCRSANDPLHIQLRKTLAKLSTNTASTLNGNQKFVIDKLRTVEGAPFNSSANQHDPTCLEKTRHELLQEIDQWADGPINGEHIYWLQGKAGTGKSTIARTVAGRLDASGLLGGSFFFKRNEFGRSNAGYLFSTIASQLARRLPAAAEHMRNAIENEPEIAAMAFQAQLNELVVRPMIKAIPAGVHRTMTVVIDALDECDRPDDMITVIKLLLQTNLSTVAPLKFFITSRDKFPIQTQRQGGQCRFVEFLVEKIPTPIVERDIAKFLRVRLDDIRENFNMSSTWPDQRQFQTLLKKSVPLFIFAATACRFIEDRKQSGGVQGRLQKILQNEYHGQLNQIYLPILNQMISDLSDSATRKALREFNLIVGSIVTVADPLGAAPLANLLGIATDCVDDRLSLLHSVLDTPRDAFSPVKIFHESFRDFLVQVDSVDDHQFQIDETAAHKILADRCISLLDEGGVLKKDICNLKEPGKLRTTIDQEVVDDSLPSEVRYACLYWVHHVKGSAVMLNYEHRVLRFLQNHLLHWLEALSLLGRITDSIKLLGELQVLFNVDRNSSVSEFLYDAKRFVLQNHQMADHAPLQLYCSGLIFAPKTSVVRRNFQRELPTWVRQLPQVQAGWSSVLQNLDGHSDWVRSIAFSPNGMILASAAFDGTVRLWDTLTGALRQTLISPFPLSSVAFSPNGLMLGSGCVGEMHIYLWDIETGILQQTLKGPHRDAWSNSVDSVAFGNNRTLASGCNDAKIRIWDTATGSLQRIIEGHSDRINQLVFSPNSCHMLASASSDKTVRLWDTGTGTLKQTLEGHSEQVNSVAFSPNGQMLASGSNDKTVRLWDSVGGTLKSTFEHPSWVDSVSFSADSQTLASSCGENEVQLWHTATCTLKHTLTGNLSGIKCAVFSPDSQMLASSSIGNTIQLWDTEITNSSQQGPLTDYPLIYYFKVSPNGQTLASAWLSCFSRARVQLWDASEGNLIWTCSRIERPISIFTLDFSPNSQMIVSACRDDRIELWDLQTGTAMLRATLDAYYTDDLVAFSPNSEILAYCTDKHTIGLCDTKTGALQRTLEDRSSQVISVVFSPNGQILASASKDKTMQLWNTATGALQMIISGSSCFHAPLAFSPTGQILLSGSLDDTTQLWDVSTGALKSTIEHHSRDGVRGVVAQVKALSHNCSMLACCLSDTMQLWDTATGTLRQTWNLPGYVNLLEFSPDDSSLKTDFGHFEIESEFGTGPSSPGGKISVSHQDGQWITLNGDRSLFLPAEARTEYWITWDRKIALGLKSGDVILMEFEVQSWYE